MTARMANPSPAALKRHDTSPTPNTRANKKRGQDAAPKIDEVRSRGTDTSNLSIEEMAEVISPDKPLTEKQKNFTKFWAQGDSIPAASLRAGFSADSIGYRMVRMPNILALKAQYEAKYEEASQMTRKKVMDMHLEAYEMSKLMAEPATMVSAAREIGKMCGYYAPVEHRVKINVTGNIILDRMNSLSDAELLKVISQSTPELPLLEDVSDDADRI